MRLNKYLALCGLGSRRKVEQYILEGRVLCRGNLVTELSYDVDHGEIVTVDDQIVTPERKIYIVINKPRGYICAVSDAHYPVILNLLPKRYYKSRLFPVGRLDLQSEGLLILTNDGDFAQEMIHPHAGVPKEYEVRLDNEPDDNQLHTMRRGISFEGRLLRPLEIAFLCRNPRGRWLRFILAEGVKREIRMIAETAGLKVQILFRRRIGRMELRRLRSGETREYSSGQLRNMIHNGGIV